MIVSSCSFIWLSRIFLNAANWIICVYAKKKAMSEKKIPYLITRVDEATNAKLLSDFHEEKKGFVQVGPKKYLLPSKYEELANKYYNFQLRPDDVVVKTFPRSGTTLISELAWLLTNDLDFNTANKEHTFNRTLTFERDFLMSKEVVADMLQQIQSDPKYLGTIQNLFEVFATKKSPRVIKTHLPFSLLPPTLLDTCKTICIVRNPKDTVVSFYYNCRLATGVNYKGDFETFYDYFEKGLVIFTPFWEQIKEAWLLKDKPNLLFLFYENVVKDLPGTIRQVAEFLGKSLNEENVQSLVQHLSFENCRKNPCYNVDRQSFPRNLNPGEQDFVRKGQVGGWRHEEFVDTELNARADAWIAKNIATIPGNFQFPPYSNNG